MCCACCAAARRRYVVDCCFVKQRAYNPLLGLEALCVAPASKVRSAHGAGS